MGCVESLGAEGRRVFGGVVAERFGSVTGTGSRGVEQEEGESEKDEGVRRKSDVLSEDLEFPMKGLELVVREGGVEGRHGGILAVKED